MEKININKELPYTVIGYTAIPEPRISITLTAEGIKAIAKLVEKGDSVRITEWSDVSNECESKQHYGRIEIIRGSEKK